MNFNKVFSKILVFFSIPLYLAKKMFYGGLRNQELLKTYISDLPCKSCEDSTEHILLIYCRAFVFGVFYPIKWWAKNKKGITTCKKCGVQTEISTENPEIPKKVMNYYHETKIPFRYKLPTLISVVTMLLLAYFIFFKIISGVFNVLQPTEKKLVGTWEDDFKVYQIYLYPDKKFTAVRTDTVIFGTYQLNKNLFEINLDGQENTIPMSSFYDGFTLYNTEGDRFNFHKLEKQKTDFSEIYKKENNTWRVKPTRPQSNEELKQKTLDYLIFERKRFELALDKKIDFLPSDRHGPVVFAANGFQVSFFSEKNWKPLFYNDDNWLKANKILEKEFPYHFKADEKEDNIFKISKQFLDEFIGNVKKSDVTSL